MPSAKQTRAASKRQARWRPTSNIPAYRLEVLRIAVKECGQAFVVVPSSDSPHIPVGIEERYMDRHAYWTDPSDISEGAPHDACECDLCRKRPHFRRTPTNRAMLQDMQDPHCAAVFGA